MFIGKVRIKNAQKNRPAFGNDQKPVDSFEGIGKPEPLRENLAGFWSRRIDDSHRLVYAVDDHHITIISCRYAIYARLP